MHNVTIDWQTPEHAAHPPELKDPSIVRRDDGSYEMFASLGTSTTQTWVVGRFTAKTAEGPWNEEEPVQFTGLSGPQLCAPAVSYDAKQDPPYRMYIQTACFEADGKIMVAGSSDGIHFQGDSEPLVTKDSVPDANPPLIGVYDASYSIIRNKGIPQDCLTFTGVTNLHKPDGTIAAHGDVYAQFRDRTRTGKWSTPCKTLSMEEVPFHNKPHGAGHYEWCLEGTQILDLGRDHYLMVGVCFLDKPAEMSGQRQRVFFAAANNPRGPWRPMHTPLEPDAAVGENGHPDAFIEGNKLHLYYQERHGDGQGWYLKQTSYELGKLRGEVGEALKKTSPDHVRHGHTDSFSLG